MSTPKARTSPYLTKSRFKVAYECPAKLFFHDRPEIYANSKAENEFLRALARGGFQVGALAKLYHPGGVDLEGLSTEEAIERTKELLKQEQVILYEAAIQSGLYLIRVDVLVKDGENIQLIEVKSSTYNFQEDEGFFKKRGDGLLQKWEPYLVDVAFQVHVATLAYPKWKIRPFLMLADSSARATVDGLHQLFRVESTGGGSMKVHVRPGIKPQDLGAPILSAKAVDQEVDYLLNQVPYANGETLPGFAKYLAYMKNSEQQGIRRPSSLCKDCEFRVEHSALA